jgi:two-component system, cell cycle sensor histidine kinase and response regulator CckA
MLFHGRIVMLNGARALFRPRKVQADFRAETNRQMVERLRVGTLLALFFIPTFVPLDYVRMHEHFSWAVEVRASGCVLLVILFGLLTLEAAERWAELLVAAGVLIVSATVLGVARFAHGAADPVYLVQAIAIIFIVTGAPLLMPLDGRSTLFCGAIPFTLQLLLSIPYDWREALPILVSTATAIIIATVGAQTGFLSRLREYEARRVLRRSESKYRTLFEESRDGLLLSAPDGRLIDANAAAITLFGYADKEEFLQLGTSALYYSPPDAERERLGRMFDEGGSSLREADMDVRHKDGRKLNVVVSSTPIRDEAGAIAGFRTIIRDVTESKALEARLRQMQKLEAVGLLAAGVAHEINNPLTYVVGNVEALREELRRYADSARPSGISEAIRARIAEACEGAQRVRQIVRDLKTFARLDEEERGAVDVVAVLDKAIKLAAAEIRYRARLHAELKAVPPAAANEGRLSQVFVNLLVNAAQAIEEGAVERNEIRIITSANDSEVKVEISDSGRGIAPEHLERLFDPFFTTKSASGGSGLGLAICYKIVTSYGGRIDVDSRVGAGTRFTVRLPIAQVAPAPAQPVVAEPAPHALTTRPRVLVVDDEPFVLSTIKMILDREHDVVGVASGSEALRLLDGDARFDLVLCDLMMQRGSGMELYAELVRRDSPLARRMAFMTGGAYTPEASRLLANSGNPCIDKPFGPAELRSVVNQLLRGPGNPPRKKARAELSAA